MTAYLPIALPLRQSPWLTLLFGLLGCASTPNAPSGAGGGSASGGAATASAGSNLAVSPGACPDASTEATDAGPCAPLHPRSFTRDIVPLFNGCAGEVCHSFSSGGIAQQVNVPSVECCQQRLMIEPGHPERSYVLQKLRGTELCGGDPMPLEQPRFNAADLQAISDWICQGASTTP